MSVALTCLGLLLVPAAWAGVVVAIDLSCEYAHTNAAMVERIAEPLPEERSIEPLPVRVPGAIYPGVVVGTVVDREACSTPCTARHCIDHADIRGTETQAFQRARERALRTPTREWSVAVLGWKVPDSPKELMAA